MKINQKVAYAITTILSACAGAAYAADATAPDEASTGGISEVLVTAQRRSESIQDVPITIQALSNETLRQLHVTTFDDVIRLLPNVTFSSNGPGR